jgi:GIY-YIG catalytic domain
VRSGQPASQVTAEDDGRHAEGNRTAPVRLDAAFDQSRGNRMFTVVYAVECRKNHFTYIGLSSDYKRRWRQHRSLLRRGLHNEKTMILDWRRFGENAFAVRVLEVLPVGVKPHDAQAAELRWQAHFARLGRLYNAPKCAMCGRPFENHTRTGISAEPASANKVGPRNPPSSSKPRRSRRNKGPQSTPAALQPPADQ